MLTRFTLAPVVLAASLIVRPAFAQPAASGGLAAAFPEVQRIFAGFATRAHLPGAAFGVIVDGELVFADGVGVREVDGRAPVDADTVFRIASMTKSFTAAAVLSLRDEGKLSLDDPAEKYVPELRRLVYPANDAPRLTVRHLLSHSAGFPEDNPWGDRQLGISNGVMHDWMEGGIPFSTTPGTAYEYSNYGFAILGQIVERVSGQPYEQFMRERIFEPLGMTSTTFRVEEVDASRRAAGYRWSGDRWVAETLLPHGAFGAMGGLWTSTRDLARWVAFMLSAFPPRDGEERGPIARRSAREMQQVWRSIRASAISSAVDEPPSLNAGGYGFGLRISHTCAFGHLVAHGGGLPGFGSQMQWLPEYGVGIIAMGNVTYANWGPAFAEAWEALRKTGALRRREPVPSPALTQAREAVSRLMAEWDTRAAEAIAADNLFLDTPASARQAQLADLRSKHGACRPDGPMKPENALRGSWRLACDRGWMDVAITLAPTTPPRVQFWGIRSVLPPSPGLSVHLARIAELTGAWSDESAARLGLSTVDLDRLKRQTDIVRAKYGSCRRGETTAGDGTAASTVQFDCDRGVVLASIAADPATGRVSRVNLAPVTEGACSR